MICVTGASGTLSSEVIRQLESAKVPFRGAYFSNKKAEAAGARGIEAVIIDYNRPETLRAAFQGCDKLFLFGPSVPNQSELEQNAVEAAKAVGLRHIVKQSVLGAAEESYSLAKVHRPAERAIESSGLAWTFLRPNSFMHLLAGALLYLAGSFLVTIVFNVPRNDALAAVDPSSAAGTTLWASYLTAWTAWNHVRTAAALAAAAALSIALRH